MCSHLYADPPPFLIHQLPPLSPREAPWIVSVNFSARRSSVRAQWSGRSMLWTASIAWTSKPIRGEAMQHLGSFTGSIWKHVLNMRNFYEDIYKSQWWSGCGLVSKMLVRCFEKGWSEAYFFQRPEMSVDIIFCLDAGYGNTYCTILSSCCTRFQVARQRFDAVCNHSFTRSLNTLQHSMYICTHIEIRCAPTHEVFLAITDFEY